MLLIILSVVTLTIVSKAIAKIEQNEKNDDLGLY